MSDWLLPPEIPWPRFLRLLRRPDPPPGWLETVAKLEDMRRRPLLLRWVAQHPKAPAHLRITLLGRLPWRALAAIAHDAAAHPQARTQATERLQSLWPVLTTGERIALALHAPRPLWRLVWKVPDRRVLANFLFNPRLSPEHLVNLLQPPLTLAQAEALPLGPWRESAFLAQRVLEIMDETFRHPANALVLGQALHWIKVLEAEEAIHAASRIAHPPLRRMVRARARHLLEE
ncbi:MAG TPA: hypothetical protein VJ483_08005 [Holophagaceae bacterium]|nr:hypothetical protein [Holophagaceae bacterium]